MNLKRTCCNMKFIFIVNWMRVLVERPKRKRLRNVSTRLRLVAEREKPVAVEIKSRNSRTAKTFNYPIKGRTNWHEESMSASPYKSIRRTSWQKPERKRRCSREHCRSHCFISLHILVTIIRNDNKKWTSTKIKRWKNTKNLLIRFTLQAMPRFRNVYSFLRSLLRGQQRVTTWRNLNKFNSLQFEYLIHYNWGCSRDGSLHFSLLSNMTPSRMTPQLAAIKITSHSKSEMQSGWYFRWMTRRDVGGSFSIDFSS